MSQNIRWKQRFEHYQNALNQLTEFIDQGELNKFEKQGLIQCFEYTYELAWRVMKDYYEYQGEVGIQGSRDAVRQAFKGGLIEQGEAWMEMIKSRVLSVHTYNEQTAEEVISKIYQVFYPLFIDFNQRVIELCQTSD